MANPRRSIAKYTVDPATFVTTFTFQDETGTVRTVDLRDFPESVQSHAAQYGIGKKLKDSYSQTDGPDSAVAQFDKAYAALLEGTWNIAREGGGGPVTGKRKRALFNLASGNSKFAQKILGMDKGEVTQENVSAWYDAAKDSVYTDAKGNEYPCLQKIVNSSKEMRIELARMATEDANASETSIMG